MHFCQVITVVIVVVLVKFSFPAWAKDSSCPRLKPWSALVWLCHQAGVSDTCKVIAVLSWDKNCD